MKRSLFLAAALISLTNVCHAQFGGTGGGFGGGMSGFGGTTGGFGSTGMGGFGGTGGLGTTSMSGLGSMGSTGTGSMGTGTAAGTAFSLPSRFGNSSTGGIGNAGGFGAGSGFANASANSAGRLGGVGLGAQSGSSGAMGGNRTGMTMGMGGMGMGGMGMGGMGMGGMGMGMGGMNNRFGMMGMNGMNNRNGNQQNSKNQLRARIAAGSGIGGPVVNAQAGALRTRLVNLPLSGALQNVEVLMEGRTAVVRGNVDSEANANLVARVLSLEPGVNDVVNELNYPGKAAESVPAAVAQ